MALQQGCRNINDAFSRTKYDGREIKENDYLSRCLLGIYLGLTESSRRIYLPIFVLRRSDKELKIFIFVQKTVVLADGYHYSADFVYITTDRGKNVYSQHDDSLQQFVTAHQMRNALLDYYSMLHLIEQLDSVALQSRMLMQRIGLSAYGVLSQLIYGRGGNFTEDAGQLHYI
ncbi:hypothetical protein [Bartonella massiliensis]|uniref:hypothetical protein n=1 Tax=Bartonella massiliensis TaxID=929795 RepID=UPI001FE5635E|nr:hypothetical protein [Bartonella massiliensis]